MSNINDKAYAMNAITPMKPWKTWILRIVFRALEIAFSLFPSGGLKELSFIHSARWVIVPDRKFPRIDESATERRFAV